MSDEIKALSEELGELKDTNATLLAENADLKDKLTAAEQAAQEQSTALADQVKAANERAEQAVEQIRKLREDSAIGALLQDGKIRADEEATAREVYAMSEDIFGKVYTSRPRGAAVPVGAMQGRQRQDETTTEPKDAQAAFVLLAESIRTAEGCSWDAAEQKAKAQKPELFERMQAQMVEG